jgi:hypothetical protein
VRNDLTGAARTLPILPAGRPHRLRELLDVTTKLINQTAKKPAS